jgi:hypothetical protein
VTFTDPEIEKLVKACTPEEQAWVEENVAATRAGRMSKAALESVLTILRDVKATGGGLVPASQMASPPLTFAIEPEPLTFKIEED